MEDICLMTRDPKSDHTTENIMGQNRLDIEGLQGEIQQGRILPWWLLLDAILLEIVLLP